MSKGYWIARVDVADMERYKAYIEANAEPFRRFGARFLVRSGRFENPEGTSRSRNVVLEFPSYQAALDCWASQSYQRAAALRRPVSTVDLVIVEGYDGPQPGGLDDAAVRFDDGAAYEQFMGDWSRRAGSAFLEWLAPAPGARWVDVGCGNGAFTQLLVERCAPAAVQGIDPSEEQLAYARTRLAGAASFERGDAMALPCADGTFDAAVMALVIFFVPDPALGVAEMARVVRPGGSVSAYAWDITGGGFPYAALQDELAALGAPPQWPPSVDAARLDRLRELWAGAGLVDLETREITVHRTYADFDTYWQIARTGPRLQPRLAAMPAVDKDALKARLRSRLGAAPDGSITCSARANAIRGRRPESGRAPGPQAS